MKQTLMLTLSLLIASISTNAQSVRRFGDEFNGNQLDPAKWDVFKGSPLVADGKLTLNGGATRAEIQSKQNFLYGALTVALDSAQVSAHIKHYTYRQPVSIGSADLESLLEYWGGNPANFDFFVFHHYESHMPPPTSQFQSLASGKPIYVGEFKIQNPPLLPLDEFVAKSRWLGYAGSWPWSLNDDPARSPYDEIRQISNAVSAASSVSPTQISTWWGQHRDAAVIPTVNQNIEKWKREREEEKKGHIANCVENRDWKIRTERLLQRLDTEISALNSGLARNTQFRVNSISGADNQQKRIDDDRKELGKLRVALTRDQQPSEELRKVQDAIVRTENDLREAGGLLAVEENRDQRNQQTIARLRNQIANATKQLIQLDAEDTRLTGAGQDTSGIKAERTAVENNLRTTGGYLAIEQANIQRAQAAIDATNRAIAENDQEKKRQKENLKTAIERMAQRCSLANWTRYKSARARSLYLNQ